MTRWALERPCGADRYRARLRRPRPTRRHPGLGTARVPDRGRWSTSVTFTRSSGFLAAALTAPASCRLLIGHGRFRSEHSADCAGRRGRALW